MTQTPIMVFVLLGVGVVMTLLLAGFFIFVLTRKDDR